MCIFVPRPAPPQVRSRQKSFAAKRFERTVHVDLIQIIIQFFHYLPYQKRFSRTPDDGEENEPAFGGAESAVPQSRL